MSTAQDTIVINLNEDLHLDESLSNNGIESHTVSRNGLDGVTGITLVVTLVASAIPSFIEIVREKLSQDHEKVKSIEWRGIRFEVKDEKKIIEFIKMLEDQFNSNGTHDEAE
jgi:hypothetical protein